MNTRELAQILLNIPSVGGARTKNIINHFDGGKLSALISRLYPFLNVDDDMVEKAGIRAHWQIKTADRAGISLVTWKDTLYPACLLSIGDFPPLIYTRGDAGLLGSSKGAALIGSRRADSAILEITEETGELLVSMGYAIVSGMALGCDSAAHRSALKNSGSTIAVLPCGPDYIYPMENQFLYHELIADRGLILSEYAPSIPPAPYRFVRRDRLQSGLSRIVVLMQSPLKGGSMHTVEAALHQKRPVFVFSGGDNDSLNSGNRFLIDSGRAIPFRTSEELGSLLSKDPRLLGYCQRSADQILFPYE